MSMTVEQLNILTASVCASGNGGKHVQVENGIDWLPIIDTAATDNVLLLVAKSIEEVDNAQQFAANQLNEALLCFKRIRETTDCNDIQALVDGACLFVQQAMLALGFEVEIETYKPATGELS